MSITTAAAAVQQPLGRLALLGTAIWALGFIIEVLADRQLAAFIKDKSNKGKVMDLGLAKRHESDNVTKTGDTFGTPAYMSPEQIAGG